jgi:thiamine biosynthesis lipoprotein ApbE
MGSPARFERRYHHITDTRTGYPVENGIDAVTVTSSRLRNADGPGLPIVTQGARRRFSFLYATCRIVSRDRGASHLPIPGIGLYYESA